MKSRAQIQLSKRDAIAAYDAFGDAIKVELARYTVRICGIEGDNPRDPGTGTGLRIGARNFVSTAAHVVKAYDANSLWLLKANGSMEKRVVPVRVGHRGGGKQDVVDVGYIEIDDTSVKQLDLKCIGLDRTTNAVERATNELVALHGIPDKPHELLQRKKGGWDIFWTPCTVVTLLGPRSTWHHGIDPDHEIEVDYPGHYDALIGPGKQLLPDAPGMSGGSLWACNQQNRNQIWSASRLQLLGIITAWHPRERWVRINRITELFGLISDDYPDLRTLLSLHL